MKKCIKCNELKDDSSFSWRRLNLKRQSKCKTCFATYSSAHHQKNKAKINANIKKRTKRMRKESAYAYIEYLQSHPCVDCGEANIVLLEADHQRDKECGVGALISRKFTSWNKVLKELAKCQIRCVTCHRFKTAREQNWLRLRIQEGLVTSSMVEPAATEKL